MNPEAVLFDLDDTLVDRNGSIANYTPAFLDRFSEQIDDMDDSNLVMIIIEADGGGYRARDEMFTQLINTLNWRAPPDIGELREHWRSFFPRSAEPAKGLTSALEVLKGTGVRMGIITNGSVASQTTKIDVLGLRGYMDIVIVSEAVGLWKPAPAIFQLALADLGLEPVKAWFVGDNPTADVLGASEVGMTPVWVRGHHPWPNEHDEPELQIHYLDELVPLVAAARNRSP